MLCCSTCREDTMSRLRHARISRLLTQRQLAQRAKVSVRTVWNAEHNHPTHSSTKRKLLKGLGLELADAWLLWPSTRLGQGGQDRA